MGTALLIYTICPPLSHSHTHTHTWRTFLRADTPWPGGAVSPFFPQLSRYSSLTLLGPEGRWRFLRLLRWFDPFNVSEPLRNFYELLFHFNYPLFFRVWGGFDTGLESLCWGDPNIFLTFFLVSEQKAKMTPAVKQTFFSVLHAYLDTLPWPCTQRENSKIAGGKD